MNHLPDPVTDDQDFIRHGPPHLANGHYSSLIGLPSVQGVVFIPLQEIVYCKGESSQTSLYLSNKKRFMVNRTLKRCEEALTALGFCRVHKSYLVNLSHIRKYVKGEGRSIELSDGTRLEVSNQHKETMLNRLRML